MPPTEDTPTAKCVSCSSIVKSGSRSYRFAFPILAEKGAESMAASAESALISRP